MHSYSKKNINAKHVKSESGFQVLCHKQNCQMCLSALKKSSFYSLNWVWGNKRKTGLEKVLRKPHQRWALKTELGVLWSISLSAEHKRQCGGMEEGRRRLLKIA